MRDQKINIKSNNYTIKPSNSYPLRNKIETGEDSHHNNGVWFYPKAISHSLEKYQLLEPWVWV